MNALAETSLNDGMERLSKREREVLACAVRGMTDDAIAHQLKISRTTVLTYWSRIRSKVGLANRVQLAAAAVRASAEKRIRQLEDELHAERLHVRRLMAELRRNGSKSA